MILSIDYGGAVAKILKIDPPGADGKAELVEFPLGFTTLPRLTISETLRLIIKNVSGGKKVEAVYASGEIASTELDKILTAAPLDPVEVLESLEMPLLDVGVSFNYVLGDGYRHSIQAEHVLPWLPFESDLSQIKNFLGNKEIYPQLVPSSAKELQIEQASARAKIKAGAKNKKSGIPASGASSNLREENVVCTGAVFSKAPQPWQVVAIILDSLEPEGLFDIYLDQSQILPSIGTLRHFDPETAHRLINEHSPTLLATTFSVAGNVKLEFDLDLPDPQELEVKAGSLEIFPLSEGQKAKVAYTTASEAGEFEVAGGQIGLVIDSRPRPLELPANENQRIGCLQQWAKGLSLETKKL